MDLRNNLISSGMYEQLFYKIASTCNIKETDLLGGLSIVRRAFALMDFCAATPTAAVAESLLTAASGCRHTSRRWSGTRSVQQYFGTTVQTDRRSAAPLEVQDPWRIPGGTEQRDPCRHNRCRRRFPPVRQTAT